MKSNRLIGMGAALAATLAGATSLLAQDRDNVGTQKVKHVLLLSVDGMHAVDYYNCSRGVDNVNNGEPYCPNLSALGKHAVNYVATTTSRPSDSFPGLMTLMTGATPKTMGIYYDVAYDRSLAPPAQTTGNAWQADLASRMAFLPLPRPSMKKVLISTRQS